MRYEHWMRPANPSPWPGAVLCLGVDVAWIPAAPGEAREHATLDSWHVQLVTRYRNDYSVARSAVGTDAESFWACLRTASLRGRNVWVLGTDFRAAASVLGLWDLLESGHVRIAGSDSWHANNPGGSVSDLPGARKPGALDAPAEVVARDVRSVRELLHPERGVRRRRLHGAKKARQGICVIEDPPIILELTAPGWGGSITWVDAANYGLSAGVEIPRGGGAAAALSAWYLRAASTLRSLGRCGWQTTAGSQSMHLYRAVYHATPTLCHTEPAASSLERDGLYGGRCEPFQLGEVAGTAHLFDFRAMYPYLYSCTPVPLRLVHVRKGGTMAEIQESDPQQWRIARVDIETDTPEYPYHDGHATVYPVGRYTSVLSGNELSRAARKGHVARVRGVGLYEASCALAGYAKALYEARCRADRDSNRALAAWLKRIANCLHGKFAQRDRHWEECPQAECPWEWAEWYHLLATGEFERRRSFAGAISREVKGGFAHGTVPAIAVAVASAGRTRLLDAIICAGWEHTVYCDTDALIVDDDGAASLSAAGWVRQGEWGYLQHVLSAENCYIGGVKRYRIGERTVEAGRHTDGRPAGGAAELAARQPGIRERLRGQLPPADWREVHPWQAGPGRYERRRLPGGRVTPLDLDQWDAK